jgi:hypothetical protein
MNIKAMQATQHEYITNFAAVKGTDYAQFISGAAVILTGCDVVLAGVRPDAFAEARKVLLSVMSLAIAALADKAGIEDVVAATNECRTMITAVDNAGKFSSEVH